LKTNKLIAGIALYFMFSSASVIADSATGKITFIQVPTGTDVTTIYFKIDPMPQGVTKQFYVRHGTGASAGCSLYGSEKTTDRAYSALLTAQASSKDVSLVYCTDSSGYGLVNGYIRVNQ